MEAKLKILSTIVTAWTGHIIFADWLVRRTKPEVVVDLGVDYGFSTFCFALAGIGHVYGVDSFEGDEHAGNRNTYDLVNAKREELGMNNVTFIKGFFDEVAKTWTNPIDILHIDGFHTYEAVKNDYDTWSKFLKPDGIVLFHDTCVPHFGVKDFFRELDLPKVNFSASFGLGVASRNEALITEIKQVFKGKLIE
jgi:predicted O-methyltransferase YrrM